MLPHALTLCAKLRFLFVSVIWPCAPFLLAREALFSWRACIFDSRQASPCAGSGVLKNPTALM